MQIPLENYIVLEKEQRQGYRIGNVDHCFMHTMQLVLLYVILIASANELTLS